jgi:hypothetical protein
LKRAIEDGALPPDLLIAGPAGTGKTYGILSAIHTLAADYAGLRILLARQSRASLTESVLVTYEQEILAADGMESVAHGIQRRVRQAYRYPNGSEVVLGGLDNPSRVLSTAWDLVFINEATEAAEEAWETIASRLKRPGRPSPLGYLVGDCNPSHPMHWLKQRADAGRTILWETTHEANPRLHDGEDWTEEGQAYRGRLDQLTGTRRKRLREGLWSAGEGLWFEGFDPDVHVTDAAEYDPALPVFMAVDTGVVTGAVFYQIARNRHIDPDGKARDYPRVNVFADYIGEQRAEADAGALLAILAKLTGKTHPDQCDTDPAGNSRNAVGVQSVLDIFARAGLRMRPWKAGPGSVQGGLAVIEDLIAPFEGAPRLLIHPRCRWLSGAFANYARKKRAGQWLDDPEDPQHPWEDVMDALRGGMYTHITGRVEVRIFT